MKKIITLLIIVSIISIASGVYFLNKSHISEDDMSYSPQGVIAGLRAGIEQARKNGDYNCCIEPACTMCYLGSWIFDEGTCHCDEAIAGGEFDKVCPECRKGIEKGECSSTSKGADAVGCDIDKKNHI